MFIVCLHFYFFHISVLPQREELKQGLDHVIQKEKLIPSSARCLN